MANKQKQKLIDEYKNKMNEAKEITDNESSHVVADDLLVQLLNKLGFQEVTEIYKKVGRWYA